MDPAPSVHPEEKQIQPNLQQALYGNEPLNKQPTNSAQLTSEVPQLSHDHTSVNSKLCHDDLRPSNGKEGHHLKSSVDGKQEITDNIIVQSEVMTEQLAKDLEEINISPEKKNPATETPTSTSSEPYVDKHKVTADTMTQASGTKDPEHPAIEKTTQYFPDLIVDKGKATPDTTTPVSGANEPEESAIAEPTSYSPESSADKDKATADTATPTSGAEGPEHPSIEIPTSTSSEPYVDKHKVTADMMTQASGTKDPEHPAIEKTTSYFPELIVDKDKETADTTTPVSGTDEPDESAIAKPTSYSLEPSADKDKATAVTTTPASSAKGPVQPIIEKPTSYSIESSVDKATPDTTTPASGAKVPEHPVIEKPTSYSPEPTFDKDKATADTVTQVCDTKSPEHPAIEMPISYSPKPSAHEDKATADTTTPVSGAKGPEHPTIEKTSSYSPEPSVNKGEVTVETMTPASGGKEPEHPAIENPISYSSEPSVDKDNAMADTATHVCGTEGPENPTSSSPEPSVDKDEITDDTTTPASCAKKPEHPAIKKSTSNSSEPSVDKDNATADTVTQVCGTKGPEHPAIEKLSLYSSEPFVNKDNTAADTTTPASAATYIKQSVVRKRVPERLGEIHEAKQPTDRSSSPLVDKKESINIHATWSMLVPSVIGFIAVIVVIYICLWRGPTESSGSSSSVLQIFQDEFNSLKADFPGQKDDLWLRSGKMLKNHLNKSEPLEPATFILTAAQDGEHTLRCLSDRLASTYAISHNARHLMVHGPSMAKFDGVPTKLLIDEELTAGFESTARAAVFYRIETLPPSSLLILYKYCDHENAAFKKVALVLTVLLDDKSLNTDMSLTELEEKVKDFIWERFISSDSIRSHHELDSDKLSGVWSRISHLVLPVLPVDSIEAGNCPRNQMEDK
ncbi:torsin-1A-interacting protein 2-like [Pseudophryne corroboree]|uniref:torsin-1A-interacting protein 2-like n=1 Tax=Pseudophryne corroboree TaxID=495146 RepID=UPI003081B6F6